MAKSYRIDSFYGLQFAAAGAMRNSKVNPYSVVRTAVAAEALRIHAHPNFSEAKIRYASAGLDCFEDNLLATKMICQTARYTLALAVFHMDWASEPGGEGASAARIRIMLTKGDFASGGWVKGAVRVFRRVGFLEQRPSTTDGRYKRIVPAAKMVRLAQDALTPMLRSLECVASLPLPAAELVCTPGFVGACSSHTIIPYLADGFNPLEAFPEVRAMLLHDYGFIVLCQLIRSARRASTGEMVAEASSVMLSRRYGMSRAQARNLLAKARAVGWIEKIGRGGNEILLTPQFPDLSERWIAHDLACWSRVVRAASHSVGLTASVGQNGRIVPANEVRAGTKVSAPARS